jgi:hypothetical protein
MILKNRLRLLVIFAFALFFGTTYADSHKILISEFMAINSSGLFDDDGDRSDWLELYNNTDAAINMDGWFLSDKSDNLKKWRFPSIVIPKSGYLIVFASGKNRIDPTKNLHANFKLTGTGEFLAISEPDTTVSFSYQAYPSQRQNISFGIYQGEMVYFTTATPGSANIAGTLPFAPNFSIKRGFYESPIDVALTLPGGNGSIYYTTNGTRPTKTDGTLYTAPIQITTTTPLSAIAINSENQSSEIVSNTYFYLKDIVNQPSNPTGYPTSWKAEKETTPLASDYQMDPRVTNSVAYKDLMENSLTSLPTMNIVTDIGNLFSDKEDVTTGGIYIYTGLPHTTSREWERPASVEYFDTKTQKEFQLNCRLKLHGGNSRRPTNSPKHGFGLTFKSAYGPSKLNFNLFDEKGVTNEFNSLVLRAGYNYTWAKNAASQQIPAQYIQDSWAKNTQLDMGQPAAHEKFVHLYLNGLYWGIYNISEKLEKDFMKSYLGGNELDYDVIKEKETTIPTDGTMVAWNALKSQITGVETNVNYQKIQGKNADGSLNPAYQNLLDVDNYIDYMLMNYYIGNQDWDANNWTVGRNRVRNDAGFRFFSWDAETSMVALTDNRIITGSGGNPTAFMQYLKKNADFKVRIADRIKKHLLDMGGALTPDAVAERYIKLADEIDMAIISESARWSDWYTPYNPYTKNDHWIPRKNALLTNYFPARTDVLLAQLKAASLYPSVNAPVFTHQGGDFNAAFNLGMSTNTGTIYYTLNGTDPRVEISGATSATSTAFAGTINIGTTVTVKARAKSGSEWSAITEAIYNFDDPNSVGILLIDQLACGSYPNPFIAETQVYFTLPNAGNLQVDIYSIDGRLVQQLYNGNAQSGYQKLQWSPNNNEKGVFICRISFEGQNYYVKLVRK